MLVKHMLFQYAALSLACRCLFDPSASCETEKENQGVTMRCLPSVLGASAPLNLPHEAAEVFGCKIWVLPVALAHKRIQEWSVSLNGFNKFFDLCRAASPRCAASARHSQAARDLIKPPKSPAELWRLNFYLFIYLPTGLISHAFGRRRCCEAENKESLSVRWMSPLSS